MMKQDDEARNTILYFFDRNMDNLGGIERYSTNLVRFADVMAERGYRLVILARNGHGLDFSTSCEIRTYDSGGFRFKNFFRLLNPLLQLLGLVARTREVIRTIDPDIVLSRDLLPVLAARISSKKKLKVLFMPGSLYRMDVKMDYSGDHGGILYGISRQLQKMIQCFLERMALHAADLVFVSTDFFRNNIIKFYKLPSDRIVKLPVGIDLNPFLENVCYSDSFQRGDSIENKISILSVSRLVVSKNIYRIIDVMQFLPDDYEWVIVGDGPEIETFRQTIIEKGLNDRIRAVGSFPDTSHFYTSCDVFVHLSYYENFGQVLIEAMASGKPPIVLKPNADQVQTATSEIIEDGVNGFFVADNPESIAQKIEFVVAMEACAVRTSAVNSAISQYAFDKHLHNLLSVVESRFYSSARTGR